MRGTNPNPASGRLRESDPVVDDEWIRRTEHLLEGQYRDYGQVLAEMLERSLDAHFQYVPLDTLQATRDRIDRVLTNKPKRRPLDCDKE